MSEATEPVGPFTLEIRPGQDQDEKPFEVRDKFHDLDVAIEMGRECMDRDLACEFRVKDSDLRVVQHEAGY